MDGLHPATRAIADAPDPHAALALARRLAADPQVNCDSQEWLTIAAVADARATTDPLWLKVKVLACENTNSSTAPTGALRARARLIATLGGDCGGDVSFGLSAFIDRAEAFVRDDIPDVALGSYRTSRATIFSVEQGTPAWMEARDVFLRCRRLREFAWSVLAVVEAGESLPAHLQRWTPWGNLDESELDVVDD